MRLDRKASKQLVETFLRLREGSTLVSVRHRRGSRANTLLATERCNSNCLMCSQPPRDEDDGWRLAENLRVISLIDRDDPQIGVSGGEPTLLGEDLPVLLEACRVWRPDTHVHVLTNGRAFARRDLAARMTAAGRDNVVWAIPLYADTPSRHDEIVDAAGAFEETLEGLFNLAVRRARVEIRIVLHALSIPRLRQLAAFIYRRLPFVEHVALMGLEPMGFAKGNRSRLWIDPVDYAPPLADSVANPPIIHSSIFSDCTRSAHESAQTAVSSQFLVQSIMGATERLCV